MLVVADDSTFSYTYSFLKYSLGSDFIVTSSSMFTFPPNSTTELCLMIDINDDNLTESHETFSVQINVLSFADNVFAGNSSVVTIYDNDSKSESLEA